MFKVMLIDDEPWILEDLKTIINWEQMGFELTGEAKSGVEALALMKKQAPDIIITDIKMPGITGLELLNAVNKKHKGVITVFISAYSEFSYAHQAVSLGAFDYLLKPVEKTKLCEVLERAKQALGKSKNHHQNIIKLELLRIVNDITEKDTVSFSKVFSDAGIDVKNKTFVIGVSKSQLPDIKERFPKSDVYTLPLGNNRFVFFMVMPREEKSFPLLRNLIKNISGMDCNIGLGMPFNNVNDIRKALNQAYIAEDQGFVEGRKSGCYFYRQRSIAPFLSEIKTLSSKEEVLEYISLLSDKIKKSRINLDGLYKVYCEILSIIYDSAEGMCGEDSKYLAETYGDIDEMVKFLENAAGERMESSNKEPSRAVIKEILDYIGENYNKKVLINEIAKRFYLNSSYLSMLFKNETGKTFTNYLVELRLDKAVEMLDNEELSLYEISDMVGYDDYFHFSKLFKKYKGISPTSYRKQIKTHKATIKKHV